MTLRPENETHRDDESQKPTEQLEGASAPFIPDLAPRKPDPENDEQVRGGRMLRSIDD